MDLIRQKQLAQSTLVPRVRARYHRLALEVKDALKECRNDAWDYKLEQDYAKE